MSFVKALSTALLLTANITDVENFLNGLFTGLVQDDNLSHIQTCLKDVKDVKAEMTEAVTDFEKKDIADIIAGAQVVYKLLQGINVDIADCKGMEVDAARIQKWSEIFKDPQQLVQTIFGNAMANMSGLKADIERLPIDVQGDDYKDLGMDVADIMTKTLGPVPDADPSAEWLDYYNYKASFPGFSSLHAHCAMQTTIQMSCADAYAALDKTVKTPNFDPANGIYAVKQEVQDQSIWVTRTTPVKHYVDDVEFLLSGTGSTCNV